MPNEPLLPIKVVIPDERRDYEKPEAGGGARKVFCSVTPGLREEIGHQIDTVAEYFAASFQREPNVPAVARLVLKDNALAKSHRPKHLFGRNTWPIIGACDFGELLVSVRPQKKNALSQRILRNDSHDTEADLSTIESIEPYRQEDVLKSLDVEVLRGHPQKLKLRLFQHNDPQLDAHVYESFIRLVERLNLPRPEELMYGKGLSIYRLSTVSAEQAVGLASFVGAQSLAEFPTYTTVRTQAISLRAAQVSDFPAPHGSVSYPVVGIVDSGVNPDSPFLTPWLVAREEFVPPQYRDYSHGSFVAGLVCNAFDLNHQDQRFPTTKSKIVDVVAFPSQGGLSEDQLLQILEDVVPKYPDVKVWNLSLAKDKPPCSDDSFSDFAVALDQLQDAHGVTFVMAAGNYRNTPFRAWPPSNLGERDRICPPADSVRGVTVAALAHEDRPNSAVRKEQPAPYSRRGPGAAFLPKPDVAHYGGNCTSKGQYSQTGILSLDGGDNLSENVGTSFATPLVSTLLANVTDAFQSEPSRCLAKALLIHSAVLRSEPLTARLLKYRGFGVPGDIRNVLTCNPWSATLVFEPLVLPDKRFVKDGFPIPACLRTPDGRVFGEIIMTVVSEPPLDARFGAEYCRRNIDVSLGTYAPGKDGKSHHHKQVPEEPKDIRDMYERQLVEHGFKWSPVKVYRRQIPRGIEGDQWRLVVEVQDRVNHFDLRPTPTAILITIRDPKMQLPVYNEVVRQMATSGWVTQDIQVQDRVRMQFRA